jgi:hypothetical protein
LLSEFTREDSRREPIPLRQIVAAAALFIESQRSDISAHPGARWTAEHLGRSRQQKTLDEELEEKVERDAAMRLPARQEYPLANVCESKARHVVQLSRL